MRLRSLSFCTPAHPLLRACGVLAVITSLFWEREQAGEIDSTWLESVFVASCRVRQCFQWGEGSDPPWSPL